MSTARVSFTPSQAGVSQAVPLPWTANPFALCWYDTKLFWKNSNNLFGILVPSATHRLDEMYYRSPMNLVTLAVHMFLVIYQLFFLASIPLAIISFIPAAWLLAYCAAIIGFNKLVCRYLLNGPLVLDSKVALSEEDLNDHAKERWIFLNGVSVGKHWLQGNVDRLAMTFRRPVRGVHNPTDGIIFDLIQCLVERNFGYSTNDVREAYAQIKDALVEDQYSKVVLILHSQGGIQGSLIVDWLLSEVPQSLLHQLEIYTFGNAANHFNNPHSNEDAFRDSLAKRSTALKSISYIEHYGNSGDFVARWGILAFTQVRGRYMGRTFERPGAGHLLNQHYLNAMFPLGEDDRALEHSEFMEMGVDFADDEDHGSTQPNGNVKITHGEPHMNGIRVPGQDQRLHVDDARESLLESLLSDFQPDGLKGDTLVRDINSPVEVVRKRASRTRRVKDFSRLWQYRDGKSPPNLPVGTRM